jgi:addiction module HigA family antidote
MGIPLNRLNEIVRGRRAITADTALRLAALLNMTPEFWMHLQASWDLHQARVAMRKAS